MEIITSLSNTKVKIIRSLKDKKARDSFGMYIAEGENIIKDMPNSISIKYLVVAKANLEKYQYIIDRIDSEIIVVDDKVMKGLSSTITPAGILAVVNMSRTSLQPPKGTSLVLDSISDSGNLGTLIRTSIATGITNIYLANCCDYTSPKVVRSTMGGIFKAQIYTGDIEEILDMLIANNISLLALDMGGESIFELSIDIEEEVAVVVGNETQGISDYTAKVSRIIALPQAKDSMDSLNASVAGGIAMYLVQNKKSNI